MSDALARAVYEALLPPGSIWNPKPDGGLDLLLLGMADGDGDVIDDLAALANLRNPDLTTILSDLEKEYGIVPASTATEAERRAALAVAVYRRASNGSGETLQAALQAAGFDVQVHENSPAVDPDTFLNAVFLMYADGPNAFAGFVPSGGGASTAVAGKTGGFLLVNGQTFEQSPLYLSFAGATTMVAGNGDAYSGKFDELKLDPIFYPVSDDPTTWPLYFFVGGDATRNVSGELTDIETVDIPSSRRTIFERIILRFKPLHTWAGLVVNYV